MILLCLLPVIALWAGLYLGARALTGCLLISMLVLQLLEERSAGDVGMRLFLFATAVGSLAVLELGARHRAQLDVVAARLLRATKLARHARARFARRSRRQKLMLQAVDGAAFCWDLRRDSLWWNARAARYFGKTSRIRAGWLVWRECLDVAGGVTVLQELQQLLISQETIWRSEFTIRTSDATIPVRCRCILVRDELGRPTRMIGALSDMTDARVAEEAARALARAARLAAIGEITAIITHEVNQPLAAILNNVETALYLMKAGRSSPELLAEILEDIRRDDLRASEVVRSTRALLQDRELVRRLFDLNDVVADAVRLLSDNARRRHIDVTVTAADLALVHADPLHLRQVMLNLLGNAFDAVEKTDGCKRVEVSTRARSGYAQVCVTDSGCGIPEADLERIFDSFHTSKAEGLGLGLSVTRSILKAHGGRIFAENNPGGRGATVRFELPVAIGHIPDVVSCAQ